MESKFILLGKRVLVRDCKVKPEKIELLSDQLEKRGHYILGFVDHVGTDVPAGMIEEGDNVFYPEYAGTFIKLSDKVVHRVVVLDDICIVTSNIFKEKEVQE
jgi:hypothetical protein